VTLFEPSSVPASTLVHQVRDTLPFVVRLSPWQFAWTSVRRMMLWFGLCALPVAVFLVIVVRSPIPLILVPIMAAVALLMIPPLMLAVRRHPVLGADEAGLWVSVAPAKKAVFLPWDAIAEVAIKHFSAHDAVCVVPRDPAVDAALAPVTQGNMEARAGQTIAHRRMRAKLGTYIHTPLTGSGLTNEDVLAKLRYYAAGRCPVG